jgi:hypothetical protein
MFGSLPWVWLRRLLAKEWQCKPWEIDLAIEEGRADEVALALKLMSLESEYLSG